jgi:hypothetical protein
MEKERRKERKKEGKKEREKKTKDNWECGSKITAYYTQAA